MVELKPCPFCGGTEIVVEKEFERDTFAASCDSCCFSGPSGMSFGKAAERWNSRPEPRKIDVEAVMDKIASFADAAVAGELMSSDLNTAATDEADALDEKTDALFAEIRRLIESFNSPT